MRQNLSRIISAPSFPGMALAAVFFLLCLLFQLLLITRLKLLYFLCLAIFVGVLFLFFFLPISEARRGRSDLWLILLATFLIRLPFFFFPRGLIFTSDNALDALQCQEIATTHKPPFFLLGALRHHMGTIKYALAAFLWEIFGSHYLLYTFIQVLLFGAILFFLYWIFKPVSRGVLPLVLFLASFSFIETAFDNSLSLRAGSEFEMAFFFLLGASLFDFTFDSRLRIFLAAYFLFFSLYLHLLGLALVAAFLAAVFIMSLFKRKLKRCLLPVAAGAATSLFHLGYYFLFVPKPPVLGGWERISFRFPSRIKIEFLTLFVNNFRSSFQNIFNFEFSYLIDFFQVKDRTLWLIYLNKALIYLSLLVVLLAFLLALRYSYFLFRRKDDGTTSWLQLFFLFLLLAFAAKCLLFEPPLLEPRHNFDLLLVIMLAYLIVSQEISQLLKVKKLLSPAPLAVLGLLLLFSLPHYYFYFKMAGHKEKVYGELMATLNKNRVRYLATDFIIAYPIYFFSGRKILVSDSLGPLTIPQFFPEMRARVDALPAERKAYLFFGPDYPARPWHKEATAVIRNRLFHQFKKENIPYRSLKVSYFILILPSRALNK